MKKESVIIYPLAKELLHGNLSIAALESAKKRDSLTCIGKSFSIARTLYEAIFIDDAWRKQKGFVSFALGMMIENYSPKTSN